MTLSLFAWFAREVNILVRMRGSLVSENSIFVLLRSWDLFTMMDIIYCYEINNVISSLYIYRVNPQYGMHIECC